MLRLEVSRPVNNGVVVEQIAFIAAVMNAISFHSLQRTMLKPNF